MPRGERLYDYFDEALYHKRRYAKNELVSKCKEQGFLIKADIHFAWLCYPFFWMKKKMNRCLGRRFSYDKKLERASKDIVQATDKRASIVGDILMGIEQFFGTWIHPGFGVRELVVCKKPR